MASTKVRPQFTTTLGATSKGSTTIDKALRKTALMYELLHELKKLNAVLAGRL